MASVQIKKLYYKLRYYTAIAVAEDATATVVPVGISIIVVAAEEGVFPSP